MRHARGGAELQPVALPSSSAFVADSTVDPTCAGTVAYAFLTHDVLPLWPVWKRYFAGCPAGSYTVLAHTQTPGSVRTNMDEVGGEELLANETVTGELRFSYRMVDAMLALYGGVARRGPAPNGCVPAWIHLASYACAPIAPCSVTHETLRAGAGRSFLAHYYSTAPPNSSVWKSSQWMTLWAPHAFALARDRDLLRAEYNNSQIHIGSYG